MFKVLLLAVALFGATPALAQTADDTNKKIDDLLGPHAIYATAIATIQKALAAHDVTALAGYIPYGEAIKVDGQDVTLADDADLAAQFDSIFNKKVVDAVTGQKYETLFVNADGIMFGNGEMWINGECDDSACAAPFINITAVNNQ